MCVILWIRPIVIDMAALVSMGYDAEWDFAQAESLPRYSFCFLGGGLFFYFILFCNLEI